MAASRMIRRSASTLDPSDSVRVTSDALPDTSVITAPAWRLPTVLTAAPWALAAVEARPGITIPEMAKEMGITPNYLYRVLPELAKDGKVKKNGKGWEPAS